ncbi:MAG: hypothetical protein Q4A54_11865, partial [Parabacteroides sp.]|nr:hypothetical protein [Parabacteroides sp.]
MKGTFKSYVIWWAVFVVVFNAVVFLTPNEMAGMSKFGGAFWAGYIFIMLAFAGQLVCAKVAFNTENLTKLFYNIPLIRISYSTLIVSIILGTACMVIPDLPNWIGAIVCIIVLGFNAISVLQAKTAAELVSEIDEKVSNNIQFIKGMRADAEALIHRADDDVIKKAAKKVSDALRYSDPVSSEKIAQEELRIADMFG